MDLIDIPLTREQFEVFDPEVVAALCAATQADLEEWSGRLLLACQNNDQDEVLRARHALKGVCGMYGAHALIELTTGPLDQASHRTRLETCVADTLAAIHAVAAE